MSDDYYRPGDDATWMGLLVAIVLMAIGGGGLGWMVYELVKHLRWVP